MEEENPLNRSNELNWEATCYIPEPHLITESSFEEYCNSFSYKEYFLLFSHGQQQDVPETKKNISPLEKHQPRIDSLASPIENDIFEPLPQQMASKKEKLCTKYHLLQPQPQQSTIANTQRSFYKNYLKNLTHSKNSQFLEENTTKFQQLRQRVNSEQMEYQNFLRSCAQIDILEYIVLNENIKSLVLTHMLQNMMKLLEQSQETYSLFQQINLLSVPNTIHVKPTILKYLKSIIRQDDVPTVKLPAIDQPLNFDFNPLQSNYTTPKSVTDKILLNEEADVFIPSQSLVTIMESFVDKEHDFIIPISVDEIQNGSNQPQKIITFSVPYPKRQMNSRQCNAIFYRDQILQHMTATDGTAKTRTSDVDTEKDNKDTTNKCNLNLFQCDEYKMLVQSNIDCIETVSRHTFQLSTKIEYQPSIGFEQLTLMDYCTSWWNSFASNSDYILLTRIDPRNDCIVKIDSYSRHVLCAPGCPYNPEANFVYFGCLISKLKESNMKGDFLLERAPGNNHVFLFQQKDNGITSVAMKYKDIISGKKNLLSEPVFPWLPIDTNILPSHCLNTGDIPWLFDLSSTRFKGSQKSKGRKRHHGKDMDANTQDHFTPPLIKLGRKTAVKQYGKNDGLEFF